MNSQAHYKFNPIRTGVLARYGKTALLQVTSESRKRPFLECPVAYTSFLQEKHNDASIIQEK